MSGEMTITCAPDAPIDRRSRIQAKGLMLGK
jgi:hypothetical protein